MHDKGLLLGVAKYGFGKNEEMLNDPELPFAEIVRAKKEECGIAEPILTPATSDPTMKVSADMETSMIAEAHRSEDQIGDNKKSDSRADIIAEQEQEEQDEEAPEAAEEGEEPTMGEDTTDTNQAKGTSESKKGRTPSEILIGWTKDRFVFKRLNILCRHITRTLHTADIDVGESNESYALAKRSGLKLTLKRTTSPTDSEPQVKRSRKKEDLDDGTEAAGLSQRAARKPQDVSKDEHGNIIYPFKAGGVEVFSLGEIVYDRPTFHSDKYIWPVGFSSKKEFRSIKDPNLRWHYRSRILDGGDVPLFEVVAEEDPSFTVVERSASTAWAKVVKTANEARHEEKNCTVSGPEYFGYGHPTCVRLIQELPNVEKCIHYIAHTFNMEKRSASKKPNDPKKASPRRRPSRRRESLDRRSVNDDSVAQSQESARFFLGKEE